MSRGLTSSQVEAGVTVEVLLGKQVQQRLEVLAPLVRGRDEGEELPQGVREKHAIVSVQLHQHLQDILSGRRRGRKIIITSSDIPKVHQFLNCYKFFWDHKDTTKCGNRGPLIMDTLNEGH